MYCAQRNPELSLRGLLARADPEGLRAAPDAADGQPRRVLAAAAGGRAPLRVWRRREDGEGRARSRREHRQHGGRHEGGRREGVRATTATEGAILRGRLELNVERVRSRIAFASSMSHATENFIIT